MALTWMIDQVIANYVAPNAKCLPSSMPRSSSGSTPCRCVAAQGTSLDEYAATLRVQGCCDHQPAESCLTELNGERKQVMIKVLPIDFLGTCRR
jgi:hypothetical protein